jgi:hypothetical protein
MREGISTIIPINGKLNNNILTLDKELCFTKGSLLQTPDNNSVFDISGNPLSIDISTGSKMNKYQLSGYIDICGNIPINTFLPMQISSEIPCEIPDITINGMIYSTDNTSPDPQLVLTSRSSLYTIHPGDYLLSSSGSPITDENGNQIVIISGSDLNYILSGNPSNINLKNMNTDYIIRGQ